MRVFFWPILVGLIFLPSIIFAQSDVDEITRNFCKDNWRQNPDMCKDFIPEGADQSENIRTNTNQLKPGTQQSTAVSVQVTKSTYKIGEDVDVVGVIYFQNGFAAGTHPRGLDVAIVVKNSAGNVVYATSLPLKNDKFSYYFPTGSGTKLVESGKYIVHAMYGSAKPSLPANLRDDVSFTLEGIFRPPNNNGFDFSIIDGIFGFEVFSLFIGGVFVMMVISGASQNLPRVASSSKKSKMVFRLFFFFIVIFGSIGITVDGSYPLVGFGGTIFGLFVLFSTKFPREYLPQEQM